ncbi:unnamed protein product [Trichobilharzia regenti]|nr:unnamed protein product [Trichobilharzia regenti]
MIHKFLLLWFIAISECLIPKVKQYATEYHACGVSRSLSVKHNYNSCYILEDALKRFALRLEEIPQRINALSAESCKVTTVQIDITEDCNEENGKLWPSDSMKESCRWNSL